MTPPDDTLPYGHVPPPWHEFYRAMNRKGQGPLALETIHAIANYERPTGTVGEAVCSVEGKQIGVCIAKDGTWLMQGIFSTRVIC